MEGLELLGGTGAGAIAGYVFSAISQARKQAHEEKLALIDSALKVAAEADKSANEAAKRDNSAVGSRVRQFIIVSLVFSFVIAPFILCFFGDIPVAVEREQTYGGYFWGIIPEYSRQIVEYVKGFYIPAEFKTAFMAIVGFYFGRSAAK